MLRNYLTVAARSLRRRLGFSVVNVLGLAAGLACVILIGLWVDDELSYDDFHPNADRTYRVLREYNAATGSETVSHTPSALAPTLEDTYSQVEAIVRVREREHPVERGGQLHVESDLLYADFGFFDVFGFEMQQGTARLDEPGTVVITPQLADRYFSDASPMGRTLRVNGTPLEVTGVVEAPPSNTHLEYSLIASLKTKSPRNRWHCRTDQTYLTLRSGTAKEAFEGHLREVARTHEDDSETDRLDIRFSLQPVTGIHLGVGAPPDVSSAGHQSYLYLFSALAVFVLLLACINFVNLSTARSGERANEVGVRKAMGAGQSQLVGQFLGESILMTGLAIVLAVAVCAAVLPAFNELAEKSLSRGALVGGRYLLVYAGLLLVVGFGAGSYPALALSGYSSAETLRTRSSSSRGSPRLRQGLIVVQFAISVALIVGTIVVHRQVGHMQNKGLGFEANNVLLINDETNALEGQFDAFTQELSSKAAVTTAAAGSVIEGRVARGAWELERSEPDQPDSLRADFSYVDYDYVETLGMEVIAGRSFSRKHPADTAGVLVNETAVEEFGFESPQAALGEPLGIGLYSGLPIIGVVRNFHYESLHRQIQPMVLMHKAIMNPPRRVAVRVQPGQKAAAIEAVRQTWKTFSDLPLDYSFLADDLAAQYEAEQRTGTLFAVFAGLALLIACLGLFGLVAYAVQQRTMEIGIRKALGATARGIAVLLSTDVLMLVGIGFAVAVPVAYAGMQRWLQNFAYRIDLGATPFVLAGLLAVGIAALTVAYQAWRAARLDPATTLRDE